VVATERAATTLLADLARLRINFATVQY
jgi:hypothetical protein